MRLPRLTGDPAQDEFELRLATARNDDEHARWKEQLKTYDGRAFVWTCVLRDLPGLEDIVGDVPTVYRQLGRRSVWLELYQVITRHPEWQAQMQAEGFRRDKELLDDVTRKWRDWVRTERAGGILA